MTGLAKPLQLYLDGRLRVFGGPRTIGYQQMGEQPVPVEGELERALASMRAGFLSGSDQIAAGVASLEEFLTDAPADEHEWLRAEVAQIAGVQERLKAKVDRLPAPSWDRFKAMVGVVKAQQTILDQVGHLVKEHVLPRQLQNLTITPFPAAPAPAREPAPQGARPFRTDDDDRPNPLVPRARPRSGGSFDEPEEPKSLLARARERTAGFRGLAAMVVAGVILSLIPRDVRLQDLGARLVEMVGAGAQSAPPQAPATTVAAEEPPAPPPARRPTPRAQRIPPSPDVAADADRAGPAPAVQPDRGRPAAPEPPPSNVAAVAARADPPAPVQPVAKHAAAPPEADEPARPAAKRADERFVPVVFTHKDYATVMRALTDLKQQYPNLLIGRQGEVQPVDLGRKGVWHRLVFLPAGPRPQATKLCDQLMAKGYDRCWVKAY